MTTPNDAENRPGFWRTLFQRGKEPVEITDDHTGDLAFEGPVRVVAGAVFEGSLRAPQVSIEGAVHGLVVAYELSLGGGGELLGDAVVGHVEVAPGATMRGWLVTVEAASYDVFTARAAEEPRLLADGTQLTGAGEMQEQAPPEIVLGESNAEVDMAQSEAELWQLRARLQEQQEAFADLEERHREKVRMLSTALQQNEQLEAKLAEVMGEAEIMGGRMESLESALQAGVQHSADQEEALMRWQELAERTQTEAAELSQQLEKVQAELEQRDATVSKLRRERENLHRLWEQAQEELSVTRAQEIPLSAGEMQRELEAAQAELQNQQEQLLWCRTSLTTIQEQLQEARAQATTQADEVADLSRQIAAKRRQAESWQGRAGRLSELLYDSVQQVKEREAVIADLKAQRAAVESEREATAPEVVRELRQDLRQRDSQISALEADARQLQEQLVAQGERLAEARADLAEMHVALQGLQADLRERNQQAEKVQLLARRRIKRLEAALARTGPRGEGQTE